MATGTQQDMGHGFGREIDDDIEPDDFGLVPGCDEPDCDADGEVLAAGRLVCREHAPQVPRPRVSGVAELLRRQRGETKVAYACSEGRLLVTFPWPLSELELAEADAAANARAGAPVEQVVEALGDVLRRDFEFRLAVPVEVQPCE